MRKNKKQIALVLLIALLFNILPTISVQATGNDIDIISKTAVTAEEAKAWARSKNATETFIGLADIFWSEAATHGGVNPAIAYVQSAKETGYGRFGGVLDESYKNPCGMKNPEGGGDYDPGAHKRFDTWEQGVQAQLDHLALYAGAQGYPRADTEDPRHFPYLKGKAKTVKSLGGNWAPSPTYGDDILKLYYDLLTRVGYGKKYGQIDTPAANTKITEDSMTVAGWALNPSGIKAVKVYVDNEFKGNARIGIPRSDINNKFPNYPGADKAGYELQIDVSGLSEGNKDVRVEQIGNDGSVNTLTRNILIDKLETFGRIDTPRGDKVSESKVTVGGWALSKSGVKEVKIYVDGQFKGATAPNVSRPDVNRVYPEYKNSPKAGFNISVDISDIKTGGTKSVVAELISNDGSIEKLHSTLSVNKLESIGRIDIPVGDEVTGNTVRVAGWSLTPSGVKEIKVYIDGKLRGSTAPNVSRPDVNRAYPEYKNSQNAGFDIKVDISDITTGGKKPVVVEMIANDGSVKSLESELYVKKLETIGRIDTPIGDKIASNKLNVGGWALTPSGVKEVKVYVDGKLKTTTVLNVSRPDVNAVYPEYKNSKIAGFNVEVDISDITTGGSKKVAVEIVGNDGSTKILESNFEVQKLESFGRIDTPRGDTISNSKIQVGGWALTQSGVKEVKVYVDGKLKATTAANVSRPDVNAAYPEYKNSKMAGFNVQVDISDITTSGSKKVVAEIVANDGSTNTLESSFEIIVLETFGRIDAPRGDKIDDSKLQVGGWALSGSGVKEIKIYVDGKFKAATVPNVSRPDVNKAYPEYVNSPKAGFNITVDISDIKTGGLKPVIAEVISNDGGVKKLESSVNVIKKESLVAIDTPVSTEVVMSDTLYVAGWALNESAIKEVKVYVDGQFKSSATLGISRPDVNNAYPGYLNGENSGYNTSINISELSHGKHEVKVEAIGNDGTTKNSTRTFYYKKGLKLVVLDAGHGGKDPGKVGDHPSGKYVEKDLNLQVAFKTKAELEDLGYSVIMRRTSDVYSELSDIAKLANDVNADLFISVHHNSFTNTTANGVEVYYTTNNQDSGFPSQDRETKLAKSKPLAISMLNKTAANTGIRKREAKDGNYFVLRNTQMPAVLIECGFLSNPSEAEFVSRTSTQQKIADSIAESVKESF